MTKWLTNWFSNMKSMADPLIFRGVFYWSVENFYQAMKIKDADIATRRMVARMTPKESKQRSKEFELREDWDEIKLAVMEYALRHKFKSGMTWHVKLMATEDPIVETNNWHDNFWGNCICGRLRCKEQGLNHLGRILTEIRDGAVGESSDTRNDA